MLTAFSSPSPFLCSSSITSNIFYAATTLRSAHTRTSYFPFDNYCGRSWKFVIKHEQPYSPCSHDCGPCWPRVFTKHPFSEEAQFPLVRKTAHILFSSGLHRFINEVHLPLLDCATSIAVTISASFFQAFLSRFFYLYRATFYILTTHTSSSPDPSLTWLSCQTNSDTSLWKCSAGLIKMYLQHISWQCITKT